MCWDRQARRTRGPRRAGGRRGNPGTVQPCGPQRYSCPSARFRVQACDTARRSRMRVQNPLESGAPRVPPSGDGAGSEAPLAFCAARQNGDFESAIREALPAILASPKFLFAASTLADGTRWNDVPDLRRRARVARVVLPDRPRPRPAAARGGEKGGLAQPKTLDTQVRRLLAAPQASSWSPASRFSG